MANGIVDGKSSNDLIDIGYVGDLEGDKIDNADMPGGSNNDSVMAGAGDDTVYAALGNDTIHGEAGNDTLAGNGGDDSIIGGSGNDLLLGESSGDTSKGNLIVNGDLATGDSSGWDYGNPTGGALPYVDNISSAPTAQYGDSWVFRGDSSKGAYISQSFETVPGKEYLLIFYIGERDYLPLSENSTHAVLSEILDDKGGLVFKYSYGVSNNMTSQSSYYFTATTNVTTLRLTHTDSSGVTENTALIIDDISVTPRFATPGQSSAGNDVLDGGSGDDTLRGNSGDDTLTGGRGSDSILGGFGDDRIVGVTAGDVIDGGENAGDNDVLDLSGSGRTNILYDVNPKNGTIQFLDANGDVTDKTATFANIESISAPNYIVDGAPGGDYIDSVYIADSEGDFIDNNDYMDGSNRDSVLAGAGSDTVYAGLENDTVDGGTGNDLLYGGSGNDNLLGQSGDDTLFGQSGDDVLTATPGNDSLVGGIGNDSLTGGSGDDTLWGNSGDDTLNGGSGDDSLITGFGTDSVLGGAGNDSIYQITAGDVIDGGENIGDNDLLDLTDHAGGTINVVLDAPGSENGIVEFWDANGAVIGTASFQNIETIQSNIDYIVSGTAASDLIDVTYTGDPQGDKIDNLDYVDGSNTDYVLAAAGNDTVLAGSGNDTIFGQSGDDSLDGGSGDDQLDGGSGADSLLGGTGNDTFYQITAGDVIDGGENIGDNDVLDLSGFASGSINILYAANPENGTIQFLDVNGAVTGTSTFANIETVLLPPVTPDYIVEGTGNNDLIDAAYLGDPEGDKIDNLDYVDGSNTDYVLAGAGDDTVLAGSGNDTVYGEFGNDSLSGQAGHDILYGGAGNDTADGGVGNDSLYGEFGDDSLVGGVGYDLLDGSIGNDTLEGNSGDDSLLGGAGDDILRGGSGRDTLEGGVGHDVIFGGAGHDSLLGASGDDTLFGGLGDDYIDGGAGRNEIHAALGNDTVIGGLQAASLFGDSGDDSLVGGGNADTLEGGAGNDTVNAASGDDIIVDSAGADVYNAGFGSDIIAGISIGDVIDGGENIGDNDVLNLSGLAPGSYNVIYDANPENGTVEFLDGNGAVTGTATFANIEYVPLAVNFAVEGTTGADLIDIRYTGDPEGDQIDNADMSDGSHNDSVLAGDGNDTVYAGAGDDSIRGGAGNDTLEGNSGNDSILGDLGNDTLLGGIGADTLEGGAGRDSLVGDGNGNLLINGTFTANSRGWILGNAGGSVQPWTSTAEGNIQFNAFDEAVYGDYISQNISTTVGETYNVSLDLLETGAGSAAHTMLIEILDDTGAVVYTQTQNVPNGSTVPIAFSFAATSPTSTIKLTNTTSTGTLNTNVAVDNIVIMAVTPENRNDSLDGGSGDDTLQGMSGDDTLIGGLGADSIVGGFGNDSIIGATAGDVIDGSENIGDNDVLDLSGFASGTINVLYAANPENGTVQFLDVNGAVTGTATFANIEKVLLAPNFIVEGGAGDDLIDAAYLGDPEGDRIDNLDMSDGSNNDSVEAGAGNDTVLAGFGNDTVHGGAGNDSLVGQTGDDTLHGESGEDILDGGRGNDVIFGGFGNDTVNADFGNDTVFGEAGNDSLTTFRGNDSIEGGTGGDTIAGGSGEDTILGGSGEDSIDGGAHRDSIDGGAGNDILIGGVGADTLIGGSGEDQIQGGTGNDSIIVDAGNDTVAAGSGDDTVQGGLGDDVIQGNFGNDLIISGSGHDSIRGGRHNDTLNDNTGNDTLEGESGDDVFNDGIGNDWMVGGLGNDSFTDALGDDTIDGGSGDDTIFGGAGNNLITGGLGSDIYTDGAGIDTFTGGAASDTIVGISIGDVIDGSEDVGDTDIDLLDLSGMPNAERKVVYDPLNGENGTVEFLDVNGAVIGTATFVNIEKVICFTRGTMIATGCGEVAIEDLAQGDLVQTMDHGLQPIRWIGSRSVAAQGNLAPVKIKAGALGNHRDLLVSPQHRMLLSGWQAEVMLGYPQVLVAAKMLVNDDTIVVQKGGEVDYFHMLFDTHEIVFANGAASESFHPGEEGWDALSESSRDEILTIFPELEDRDFNSYGPSARISLKAWEAKLLA